MNDLDFMVADGKESRYLSLEDFEKKDKESQEKVKKATSTENESTQYLYNMIPNMKRNDYHRAEMTPYAFCGGDKASMRTNLSKELAELKEWRKQLNMDSWYKQVSEGEALWRKYPVIHHKEEEESEELMNNTQEEDTLRILKEQRMNYLKSNNSATKEDLKLPYYREKASSLYKKVKRLNKVMRQLKEYLDDKENKNFDVEGKYFTTMKKFSGTIKKLDISETFGLDAVEENLKKAMELAEKEKESKGMIAPSDIKELLSTFRNLRKTQLDNITQNIPSGLDKERRRALITVYETDFWELYEMKVREVLRKYDNKNDKPKQEEGIKVRITKFIDKIKGKIYGNLEDEKFDNEEKVKEIIAHLDLNELFDETKHTPKGVADFRKTSHQVYDLIAATLRPKDNSDDGRAEWNTYGSYYNNLKDIMDEYMEDDDDWSSNSKGNDNKTITEILPYEDKERKKYNRIAIKFTYTLYAILRYCANEPNEATIKILTDRFCNDMYDKLLFDNKLVTGDENSLETGVFGAAYKALKKFCDELKGGSTKSKSEVETLLEEFSDIKGISKKGELFYALCANEEIKMSKHPYRTGFEKLMNLKDSKDNVKSTAKSQEKDKANPDNV